MGAGSGAPHDDRVLPFTRGLSLFITPFLLVAWVILYLFPDHTARLWAWPIPSTMTSMVLASAYLGGAYFFVRVTFVEKRWNAMAVGFLAVTAFASLLGVATAMHWDKFTHDNPAFWLWAGLYFVAPWLVIGAWLTNRRYAAPAAADEVVLRRPERVVIAGLGAASLVMGAVMFISPETFIPWWPWVLTPLTARVMAAVFCLGSAGAGSWLDPRWSSLRLMLQVEVVMLALMLVAAVRASDELIPSHALAWPLLVGVLLMLAGSGYLWARYERGPRLAR